MSQRQSYLSQSRKFILAVALILAFSGLNFAQASTTPTDKAYAKVSFAALNALNFSKTDAISIFGSAVKVDSSKAGPITEAGSLGFLSSATKGLGGNKKVDPKSVYKSVASCNTTSARPDLIANGSTYTYTAAGNSYIGMLTSAISPAAGDGALNALSRMSKTSCLFSGVNSGLGKIFAGSKSGLVLGAPTPVNNPNFPTGTYGLVSKGAGKFNDYTLPVDMYLFLAGKGNIVATYEFIIVSIPSSISGSKTSVDYSKELAKMENSVIAKISAASPTSN